MKFFRKDWILYDEIAKDGGQRPDTLIELKVREVDEHQMNHIPDIKKVDCGYEVNHNRNGTDHPMNIKHHLVTTVLVVDQQWVHRFDFKHTDKPNVLFEVKHGTNVEAYTFCNLHGLYYSKLK